MTDNEIKKALERLKSTKDYLKEQYQEQVKKCPYPELKPIAKQTYEDNKKAFDIAIKAIEEINRLQAENEKNENIIRLADKTIETANAEIERLKAEVKFSDYLDYESTNNIKAEAYKEFAEELCQDRVSNDPVVIAAKCLLKEKVGEDNG